MKLHDISDNDRLAASALKDVQRLASEASKPKAKRSHVAMLQLWRAVWPALNELGIMDELRENQTNQERFRAFLLNSSVFANDQTTIKKRGSAFPDHDYSGRRGINPHRPELGENPYRGKGKVEFE